MIEPLGAWVLVEPVKPPDETESGIKLVESVQNVPQRGRLVSKGPDAPEYPAYGADEVILLHVPYGGHEVEDEGRTYLMLRPDEILGRVT